MLRTGEDLLLLETAHAARARNRTELAPGRQCGCFDGEQIIPPAGLLRHMQERWLDAGTFFRGLIRPFELSSTNKPSDEPA